MEWSAQPQGRRCLDGLTGFEVCLYDPEAYGSVWVVSVLPCLATAANHLRYLLLEDWAAIDNLNLLTGLTSLTCLRFKYDGPRHVEVVTPFVALSNLRELSIGRYLKRFPGLSAEQADALKAAVTGGQLSHIAKLRIRRHDGGWSSMQEVFVQVPERMGL